MTFEKVRQFQGFAERRGRLVHGEAGLVGRDLEQNMAGFAEIDRAEIVAVLLLGRLEAVVSRAVFFAIACSSAWSAARKAT